MFTSYFILILASLLPTAHGETANQVACMEGKALCDGLDSVNIISNQYFCCSPGFNTQWKDHMVNGTRKVTCVCERKYFLSDCLTGADKCAGATSITSVGTTVQCCHSGDSMNNVQNSMVNGVMTNYCKCTRYLNKGRSGAAFYNTLRSIVQDGFSGLAAFSGFAAPPAPPAMPAIVAGPIGPAFPGFFGLGGFGQQLAAHWLEHLGNALQGTAQQSKSKNSTSGNTKTSGSTMTSGKTGPSNTAPNHLATGITSMLQQMGKGISGMGQAMRSSSQRRNPQWASNAASARRIPTRGGVPNPYTGGRHAAWVGQRHNPVGAGAPLRP